MAAVVRRLFPGCSTKGYEQFQPNQWGQSGSNLATVTALVTRVGAVGQVYMLTAGHAFKDCDENKGTMLAPANLNNVLFPGPLPNLQNPVSWAENRLRGVPYANSFDVYHCAGDKLGSHVDAGLAVLVPGLPAGTWDNIYAAGGLNVTLNAIDAWPPVLPPGEQYFLGAVQVAVGAAPAGLNPRPNFTVDWPTCIGGTPAGVLNNVMVTSTRHNSKQRFFPIERQHMAYV
jgi:hypothetical protein